jgi:methylmalonyl-CoA mutase N-terminal domain/subunit
MELRDEFSTGSNSSSAGEFPYTSGIYPKMYQAKPWTIRQYSGFGTAKEANENFKKLILAGNSGISIAFDLPTQMGLNPNTQLAKYECGKIGVSVNTLSDMRLLLDGIDLGEISTSMTINSTAGVLLLMYELVASERGIPKEKLVGTIQNDILKEFITRSTHIFPVEHSIRFTNDVFEYCFNELPNWNPISVSGYHFSEAGASPAQELAFTISNAVFYLEGAISRGLPADLIARRFTFFFSARTNLLEEVAKFRAARRIWAKTLKEKFFITDTNSLKMRIHAQTAGSQLTATGLENNFSRVAIQSLAAVFGGVQSLHTNSYNEAISLPTEQSSKLAINTQYIILHETDLATVVDPFEGSYVIENLTNSIESSVNDILHRIEDNGGVVNCIESNFQRSLIEQESYLAAKNISKGIMKIVGINSGIITEFDSLNSSSNFINESVSKNETGADNLLELTDKIFKELIDAANGNENVMYPIKRLLIKNVSLSQIIDVLKSQWGTWAN